MKTLHWIIIFGFLMSCIALVGSLALLFPHFFVEQTLLAFVAFAAGSLLGGAVFHMIPAAVEKMGNTTEVYLWLIAGFVLFLALETFLNWHHSHTHSHSCSPLSAEHRHDMPACLGSRGGGRECPVNRTDMFPIEMGLACPSDSMIEADAEAQTPTTGSDEEPTASQAPHEHQTHEADDVKSRSGGASSSQLQQPRPPKQPLTYLILIADTIHNFTGGLFVGASFVDSVSLGLSAWLAAAAHEVPQELGDFAILVHGGWDKKAALLWNFLSALTFPVGAIIAYLTSKHIDVSFLIPFAAGNFLYIGATDLIPEIKHYHGVRTNLVHFSSFVLGIAVLLVIRVVADGW